MSLKKTNNKGFTLIELVIVLAIAALIIAAVLIAVRGAQQSRRDAARRDATGQIGAILEEYAGNHNGVYPTTTASLPTSQINSRTSTPDGGSYSVTVAGTYGTCPPTLQQDTVQVSYGTGGSARKWQIAMGLEGNNAAFCANS